MNYRHINNVFVTCSFSDCGHYRYRLAVTNRRIQSNKKVCAIMQNPSNASEERADRSVQFLEKLIFEKSYKEFEGVSELIVVNQFAFIQTKNFIGGEKYIGKSNDDFIREAIEECEIVLIAWGRANPFYDRQGEILKMIDHQKKTVLITKKHPSRGSYQNFIEPYCLDKIVVK